MKPDTPNEPSEESPATSTGPQSSEWLVILESVSAHCYGCDGAIYTMDVEQFALGPKSAREVMRILLQLLAEAQPLVCHACGQTCEAAMGSQVVNLRYSFTAAYQPFGKPTDAS